MRIPLAVFAALVLSAPPALAAADLSAKPGGKIKIVHGAPPWRDEFEAELKKPDLNWRLGSNAATTLTTEGGMVFEDCVVLPGEYNLALVAAGEGQAIVFHHDGTFYGGQAAEGWAKFEASKVDGKQVAKSLAIDLSKGGEKEGYRFRITFGPHRLEQGFQSAKARTVKGKAGDAAFSAVHLERTDLESLKKQAEAGFVLVTRIERKGADPLKLQLRTGSPPKLKITGGAESGSGETIEGKAEQAKSAATSFTLTFAEGDEAATATYSLGDTRYVFELPAKLLETAKPRGR